MSSYRKHDRRCRCTRARVPVCRKRRAGHPRPPARQRVSRRAPGDGRARPAPTASVVISSYDWLSRRVDKDLARKHLDRGQSAITQLIEQLDHLVSALRLHERKSGIEGASVALGPIFAALERDQRDFANLKDVRLDIVPTQAAIISDEVLLKGILHNLTRNALKYTHRHGRVLLGADGAAPTCASRSMTPASACHRQARVSISDFLPPELDTAQRPRSRAVRGQACRRSARSSRRGLLDARPRIVLCRGCQGGRGRAAVGARGVTGPPPGGSKTGKN